MRYPRARSQESRRIWRRIWRENFRGRGRGQLVMGTLAGGAAAAAIVLALFPNPGSWPFLPVPVLGAGTAAVAVYRRERTLTVVAATLAAAVLTFVFGVFWYLLAIVPYCVATKNCIN
jgi:hypothetical protein